MAIDVGALKPRKTTMPKRQATRTKRDLGPNPWLDANWPYSLKNSYDNAEAYELDFKGKMEELPLKRGKNKGKIESKLTGDASDAVILIRDAADKLKIGASVVAVPAKGPGGKERPGWYTVKYQGQKRKASKATAPATPAAAAAPAAPAPAAAAAPGAEKPAS